MTSPGQEALVEFLLERVAEDKAQAELATSVVAAPNGVAAWDDGTARTLVVDPRRALADCEARSLIVGWVSNVESWGQDQDAILGWLAQPYADHPDYRDEWRIC